MWLRPIRRFRTGSPFRAPPVGLGWEMEFGIGREGCYRRREGTWRVPPQVRACHEAQAIGDRLSRIENWNMKAADQLSVPLRIDVLQQCG